MVGMTVHGMGDALHELRVDVHTTGIAVCMMGILLRTTRIGVHILEMVTHMV